MKDEQVFPIQARTNHEVFLPPQMGMTRRQLISAMAMQGILSNPNNTASIESIAEVAVKSADALIAELSK